MLSQSDTICKTELLAHYSSDANIWTHGHTCFHVITIPSCQQQSSCSQHNTVLQIYEVYLLTCNHSDLFAVVYTLHTQ